MRPSPRRGAGLAQGGATKSYGTGFLQSRNIRNSQFLLLPDKKGGPSTVIRTVLPIGSICIKKTDDNYQNMGDTS